MDGLALGAGLLRDGEFVGFGARDEAMQRLVTVRLAGEDEIGALGDDGLRDGLASEEIVTGIDRLEASRARPVEPQPAFGG